MHPPPPCASLGRHCRTLPVTLLVATSDQDIAAADHEATWLLGHTERIDFGRPRRLGPNLLVDAELHVRCRHLKPDPAAGGASGVAGSRCAAHGFTGPTPPEPARPAQPRQLGADRFQVVQHQELVQLELPEPPRSLPVLDNDPDAWNPCSIAPCTTADHKRGSACCRDLQIEILCDHTNTLLEALVRSRLSPYLCKITRTSGASLEAEMISACGFLDRAGLGCTLHGRVRPDGRPAKPDLCSLWPDDGKGMHPGCIFYTPPRRSSPKAAVT